MKLYIISTGSKNGNCYILENSNEVLLLDAGVEYKILLKAINYNLGKITGVLLTHAHGDHSKAIHELITNGINCYGCKELEEMGIEHIPERQRKFLGGFSVVPMYVPHDDCPCYAYLIDMPNDAGRLLYATDFSYMKYRLKAWNINHILIECNHVDEMVDKSEAKFEHSLRGHSSLSYIKKFVEDNKTPWLRNTILCHLSEGWSDPERMQREVQEVAGNDVSVYIAKPGLNIELSRFPF